MTHWTRYAPTRAAAPRRTSARDPGIWTHPVDVVHVGLVDVDVAATKGPEPGAARHVARPPVLPIRLPGCSKCRHRKILTIFVFDESGSVQSRSDPARPIANRRAETAVVLDHLGTCRCGNELICFVYFDTGDHDMPPTPLTKSGATAIRAALGNPAPATSSCMSSALTKARAIADEYPEHDIAIVVYSDFELYDHDVASVLAEFAAVEGHPHAVVLHSPVPNAFLTDGRVTVTHVRWDSVRGAVAHALLPVIGRERQIDGNPGHSATQASRERGRSS